MLGKTAFATTTAFLALGTLGSGVTVAHAGGSGIHRAEAPVGVLGKCPDRNSAKIPGALAVWEIRCKGKDWVVLDGRLKDTKKDGKCARLRLVAEEHTLYRKACGKGKVVDLNSMIAAKGNWLKVYLYTR
ncbi:hypothetical protein ABZY93_09830 [Streptomyces smyrnaeus]|uniref:hypothetical protein n=1 Tax=Streptomyces smyrnaeus TaxID=1387713 RepID=UPI0033ABB69F